MRALVILVLLGVGCNQSAETPAPAEMPPPLAVDEAARGEDACKAYISRLCACAEKVPALADECELKQAKLSALDMALRANRAGGTTARQRLKTGDTARRIVASCIAENNALDAKGCAR